MPTRDRSTLRIADLKRCQPAHFRLMNVWVPAHQADAIAQMAKRLGANKIEVVVALLNAGLEAWRKGRR